LKARDADEAAALGYNEIDNAVVMVTEPVRVMVCHENNAHLTLDAAPWLLGNGRILMHRFFDLTHVYGLSLVSGTFFV
jgi:hypothetical protein